MSEFFPNTEKVVAIDGDNEVTIKLLTFEERMIATGRARSKASGDDQAAYIFLRLEMTKMAVKSWRGSAFNGTPCTPENIGKLSIEIASPIADAVMTYNIASAEEEETEKNE